MASSAPSNAISFDVIIILIIVLLLARRTYAQITGAAYSVGQLFGFAGFYVLIFGLFAAGTILTAVLAWGTIAYLLLVPYLALPAITAFFATPYIRRVVQFEERGDGRWYYRLSWHIPVLYLVLFVARFAAEIAVFGPAAFIISFPPPAVASSLIFVLIGVDLMFSVSMGLLIGRGVGVYLAHQQLPKGSAAPPSPPSPPLPSQ
jgi:hypothetical protein